MPENKDDFSLFTACDKARHRCDKSQYNEATLLEKIKLNIHLLFCGACREYSANNNKLTKVIKKDKNESFDSKEKNDLEKMFQDQLNKSK